MPVPVVRKNGYLDLGIKHLPAPTNIKRKWNFMTLYPTSNYYAGYDINEEKWPKVRYPKLAGERPGPVIIDGVEWWYIDEVLQMVRVKDLKGKIYRYLYAIRWVGYDYE